MYVVQIAVTGVKITQRLRQIPPVVAVTAVVGF